MCGVFVVCVWVLCVVGVLNVGVWWVCGGCGDYMTKWLKHLTINKCRYTPTRKLTFNPLTTKDIY